MKGKNKLLQTSHYSNLTIMIVTVFLYSLCFTNSAVASDSEEMTGFSSYSAAGSGDSSTIFLEENGLDIDLQQSIKIILPSGEGIELSIIPFYLTKIDSAAVEIFLQDSDALENTIVVSDTCEVIGIIAILLAAACLIYPNPILCSIATVMQGIFRLLCQ
jgi:hypothetical protein